MKAVIIDDEYPAINELTFLLRKLDMEVIGAFTSPMEGYEFLLKERPEVVFLDIEMPQMNGIELGVSIKRNLPSAAIIYVTAYPQYALESFQTYPIDYILKPIDEERFAETVARIRLNASSAREAPPSAFRIKCFGKFKVLSGDEEMRFPTQKAKELLAYLICNDNKTIYRDEILQEVFKAGNEKKSLNNLRVTMHRLRNALMEKNISKEQLLIRNDYSLRIADGVCDLIDYNRFAAKNVILYTQNIVSAISIAETFHGDFMSDIDTSWVTDFREHVLLQMEDLLMKIGLYYIETEKKTTKAEWYFSRVLKINAMSEAGYMALLDLYINTGNIAKFVHTYKAYSKLLEEEFASKPENRFLEFYRQHIKK